MDNEKTQKNTSKEAPTGTISPLKGNAGKDTLEPKSSISQAQNPSNPRRFEAVSQLSAFLDDLAPKTKVKVKILDFESFRLFLPLCNKYSIKFEAFKYDTEFNVVSDLAPTSVKNETINFKESFTNWLKNQAIDEKIRDILLGEIK